ncbi:MAG TPA: ABC transporter ATP-binding protein [Gemmatimonadaceae bacterium]|nr:ABC transporter ATP-binding protein [Gemmatimonadaceae bacterium]
MSSPAVVVSGVEKRFGKTEALTQVSFDVQHGELFGLVGPDGAGKSTLFRVLTTLLEPDAGTASVLGLDVVRDLWAIRSRVGYMPGRFSLYGDLSVAENLSFFASVFGTTVEKGYELIAPIYRQIEPFSSRRADALSGGMKQKLALSCALVHRPDILFLDEPTTGVDAVSRREFWDQLQALRASGLTILVSTPYMDEAIRCDRVALLQSGHILEIAPPGEIGTRYPLPLLAVRGAERYRLLLALRSAPHVHSVFPFGADIHFTDDRAHIEPRLAVAELARYIGERGFRDVTVEAIRPGIEDSFMELMPPPVQRAS